MKVRCTYSCIHENEVHLHKGKDHLEQWIYSAQNLMAWRIKRYFKERSKLQANVNHCAQTKSYTIKNENVPINLNIKSKEI